MVVVFFFQAEDGIRDLVRSRGLGDVYKRQELIIKVDSKTNIMELFAKNGENEEKIKSYIVSTLSLIHI